MEWFSKFLGWLFSLVYSINGNYLAALILFTLLTKIILLPLSIIVHKNSIKLVKLTPEINNIKYSPPTSLETREKSIPQESISLTVSPEYSGVLTTSITPISRIS